MLACCDLHGRLLQADLPEAGDRFEVALLPVRPVCGHCAWCGRLAVSATVPCYRHGEGGCPPVDGWQCAVVSLATRLFSDRYGALPLPRLVEVWAAAAAAGQLDPYALVWDG